MSSHLFIPPSFFLPPFFSSSFPSSYHCFHSLFISSFNSFSVFTLIPGPRIFKSRSICLQLLAWSRQIGVGVFVFRYVAMLEKITKKTYKWNVYCSVHWCLEERLLKWKIYLCHKYVRTIFSRYCICKISTGTSDIRFFLLPNICIAIWK